MMTRKQANQIVSMFGQYLGLEEAKLNASSLAQFFWHGKHIYFEYEAMECRLIYGSIIFKFREEIDMKIVNELQTAAQKGEDTGGGKVELVEPAKGIFLTRSLQEFPVNPESLISEIERLATAGLEWSERVFPKVVSAMRG